MIHSKLHFAIITLLLMQCTSPAPKIEAETPIQSATSVEVELLVLGTLQDAGSPHIACQKACCKGLFEQPDASRKVVSLGVVDNKSEQTFLFEATPDMPTQVKALKNYATFEADEVPNGIFLTHAHIGHYTGLMYLGKEAMNAQAAKVYAMPRMQTFLEQNGPWSQLVTTKNIAIQPLQHEQAVQLSPQLHITPFRVPHRDEYSETVGYKIIGPNKSALFIPDIDKWEKWELSIIEQIATVDYAFLDGTFYDAAEINHRDISQIPHPFIIESMEKFKDLPQTEREKIHFIHFNHTNPMLGWPNAQGKTVLENGFRIAQINQVFSL